MVILIIIFNNGGQLGKKYRNGVEAGEGGGALFDPQEEGEVCSP